jgi:two-component system, OmpR family, response regulator
MPSLETILILEDTALVRDQVRARFETEGYRVIATGTIPEALRCAQTQTLDVVVLDLCLTNYPASEPADGFTFLRALRGTYSASEPAVIIFSVNDSPELRARAKALGVFDTIAKKQGTTALVNAVRDAIAERKEALAASHAG